MTQFQCLNQVHVCIQNKRDAHLLPSFDAHVKIYLQWIDWRYFYLQIPPVEGPAIVCIFGGNWVGLSFIVLYRIICIFFLFLSRIIKVALIFFFIFVHASSRPWHSFESWFLWLEISIVYLVFVKMSRSNNWKRLIAAKFLIRKKLKHLGWRSNRINYILIEKGTLTF